jgi:hypothetical protein
MSANAALDSPADLAPGTAPVIRRLAVTWQHPVRRSVHPVGLLEYDGASYRFRYIRNVEHVVDLDHLLGFPDRCRNYSAEHLFPLFAQRVMDPRRPDYDRYLTALSLNGQASPWEQLARSGGRRAGDTIQLFPEPTVDEHGWTTCLFLAHGIRHIAAEDDQVEAALAALAPGTPLRLVDEPDNVANNRAVLVSTIDGRRLGYVPDFLLDHLAAVRGGGDATVRVVHVNGPEAPWHLRLLCRLDGRAWPGYVPFDGPEWTPLA